jgi:hypothetical protein
MEEYLISKKKRPKESHYLKQEKAEQIKYSYQIEGNQLILDNYFITDLKNKFRNQEIEITLYLPKGTLLKPDESMKIMIVPMRTTLWNPNSNNNVYRVEDDKVRCLNCSDDEEDQNDNENNSITITKNGVSIITDTVNGSNNDIKDKNK